MLNKTIAVPINKHTLDIIAEHNDGVEPEIEAQPTYFVITGFGTTSETAEIITQEDFEKKYERLAFPFVKPVDHEE